MSVCIFSHFGQASAGTRLVLLEGARYIHLHLTPTEIVEGYTPQPRWKSLDFEFRVHTTSIKSLKIKQPGRTWVASSYCRLVVLVDITNLRRASSCDHVPSSSPHQDVPARISLSKSTMCRCLHP